MKDNRCFNGKRGCSPGNRTVWNEMHCLKNWEVHFIFLQKIGENKKNMKDAHMFFTLLTMEDLR